MRIGPSPLDLYIYIYAASETWSQSIYRACGADSYKNKCSMHDLMHVCAAAGGPGREGGAGGHGVESRKGRVEGKATT